MAIVYDGSFYGSRNEIRERLATNTIAGDLMRIPTAKRKRSETEILESIEDKLDTLIGILQNSTEVP